MDRRFLEAGVVALSAAGSASGNVCASPSRRLAQMDKMGLPKPATYTDVRKLLEDKSIDALSIAAQRYNRVVQHGTQTRSAGAVREAVAKMKEGLIGETYMARGPCYKWRDTIGRTPVPGGVNDDLWTGPAPLHGRSLHVR